MKMTHELNIAYHNMMPGKITQEGFLGDDNRKLVDIIAHDEELVAKLNLSYDKLTAKMEYLLTEGLKGLGEFVEVDNTWLVKVDEVRGNLPCPFEDGIYHKRNIQVKNIKLDKIVNFSDLSIHLIKTHHFFQGKGSFYRLEPHLLKDVLVL